MLAASSSPHAKRNDVPILLLVLAIVTAAASAAAQPVTGGLSSVTVSRSDTLRRLGSRLGVDPHTIAADNDLPVVGPLPVGRVLLIDNRHIVPAIPPGLVIVVNIPQRMLFLVSASGVTAYPVAVGRPGWRTPLRSFSIVSKETNPSWEVPASIRAEARRAGRFLPLSVPPGPNNPLGKYWLGLSIGGVGVHGTNSPASIYQVVTHGCIRLHADDVRSVFGEVSVGAAGMTVYEPVLLAVDGDTVFLEAHRDVYQRGPRDAREVTRALAHEAGLSDRIDWTAAETVLQRREGVARDVTRP